MTQTVTGLRWKTKEIESKIKVKDKNKKSDSKSKGIGVSPGFTDNDVVRIDQDLVILDSDREKRQL